METSPATRPLTGTAQCDRCPDTITRDFTDQRWSSAAHGDICYGDTETIHRIHRPAFQANV